MILCDLDMVLATSGGDDTFAGRPIYRTFAARPHEFDQILEAGIPFFVVTAKVEKEARQVISAIGLDRYVTSVIAADHLFWPTLRESVAKLRVPKSISKAFWRSALERSNWELCTSRRVVMIEDRKANLFDMLAYRTIDVGILVPPTRVQGDVIRQWFDLRLVLRLALNLALGISDVPESDKRSVKVSQFSGSGLSVVDAERFFFERATGRHLIEVPASLSSLQQAERLTLHSWATGHTLKASRGDVVSLLRACRRIGRKFRRL